MGKSDQAVPVTVLNFVRAETDMTMDWYVKMGVFGKFLHLRQSTPLDKQDIIRLNRDTLSSLGTFDLTEPLTITKPDPGNRFMSLNTSNQDHSISQAIYGRFGTSSVTPNLTLTGDGTIPERLALLHEHRTSVVAEIAELQHNLERLDGKLAYYADTFGVTAGEPTP